MVRTELMEYQKRIVKFCKDREYFGIFSGFGTGKTLSALKIKEELGCNRMLVISTLLSIKDTWVSEIEKHTTYKYVLLIGSKQARIRNLKLGLHKSYTEPVIFLVNFDGVKTIANAIIQANFDVVFVDESTKIKDHRSTRSKAAWYVGNSIPIRGILTGFPITEGVKDIYSQIKFLDNGATFGDNYYAFMNTYFVKGGFKYIIKKKSIGTIVDKLKNFCIFVDSDDVDLPKTMYRKITVPQTVQQNKLLAEFKDEFRVNWGTVSIDTKYIFVLLNKSLQICNGFIQNTEKGKIKELEFVKTNKDEILLDILSEIGHVEKVIIWFSFNIPLIKVKHILTGNGYKVLTLLGETKDEASVTRHFNVGSYNILLASLKKASESINLTNCRYAVYYGNFHSGDIRKNSEGRIRRMTSKASTAMYIDLCTEDSVEEDILQCFKTKNSITDAVKQRFRDSQ